MYQHLGLESVGLRYFTVYGPRQRPDMAMRRLCEAACGGETFALYGDGGQWRDFTHVSDVVDATIRAAVTHVVAPVLNIGGGNEATMTEVIATIEDLNGAPLPLTVSPSQRGDVRRTGADTTLARTQLGWQPAIGLVEGLRRAGVDACDRRRNRSPALAMSRSGDRSRPRRASPSGTLAEQRLDRAEDSPRPLPASAS